MTVRQSALSSSQQPLVAAALQARGAGEANPDDHDAADRRLICGLVEGIVPETHPQPELHGCASFLGAAEIER